MADDPNFEHWNGLCAWRCRQAETTVDVPFREGRVVRVYLQGKERDPRLGVSITTVMGMKILPPPKTKEHPVNPVKQVAAAVEERDWGDYEE
jgi:hypothetical protein